MKGKHVVPSLVTEVRDVRGGPDVVLRGAESVHTDLVLALLTRAPTWFCSGLQSAALGTAGGLGRPQTEVSGGLPSVPLWDASSRPPRLGLVHLCIPRCTNGAAH